MSRNIMVDMKDYLPKYYSDSGLVENILEREAEEFILVHTHIQDILNQFFVDTATWGLAKWEEICGISIDVSKPVEQRRSVIKSKLRGAGTITIAVIKNVVDSFQNGEVTVEENFGNYEVIVTFVGKRGIPPNLDDVNKALREIVPAHLHLLFRFTYLTWEELDTANLTWDQLDALNKAWDDLEVWKP